MSVGCIILDKYLSGSSNIVKVAGTVEDPGKNPVARTVHLYYSGTDDFITETESDDITGDYEIFFTGEESIDIRIEAFADENSGDENSQVDDFVNPIQHSTIV